LVRRLRSLRRDRKLRDTEGVLVAEGFHLAQEALRAGAAIETAVASPRLAEAAEGDALLSELEKAGVEVHTCSDALLATLQDAHSPQPVLLVVRRRVWDLETLLKDAPAPALIVVAHGVQDPGNLGSIVRTADAAGATALVAIGGGADLFHPRTVRATMGSIFRLPAVPSSVDGVADVCRARGVRLVGSASRGGDDYRAFDWSLPTALFLGSEGSGLPDSLIGRMDATVRIPLRQGVDSLSVGAAAAVLLFEGRGQVLTEESIE
jgi:TrmH family RNA methyltransferase